MIDYDTLDFDEWFLTDEGTEIVECGSHEVKVFNAVPNGAGIDINDLQVFFACALILPGT